MEKDITLVFLKYLMEYDKIDIIYLDSLDADRFVGSNIHKLVVSLCVNYMNLNSEILNKKLRLDLKMYRNPLVHCEGSVSSQNIKYGIMALLKDVEKITDVAKYNEYEFYDL